MRHDQITFRGQPVTLKGHPVEVGDLAPDFAAHTRYGELIKSGLSHMT
ncbi:MAG: hypothetical protein ACNA8W_08110 [Bradymonadaceae bacterium]